MGFKGEGVGVSSVVSASGPERRRMATNGEARADGTGPLFAGYIALLGIEYLGLAYEVPALRAMRLATVLSYGIGGVLVLRFGVWEFLSFRQSRGLAVFIAITIASLSWAHLQNNVAIGARGLVDYTVLCYLTFYLVDRSSRRRALAAALALISGVLVWNNLSRLGSSVRYGAFRAGYFMGDGNDFAWGMSVIAPIIGTLAVGQTSLLMRLLGVAGTLVALFGVAGTQSRGGALGTAAAWLYGVVWLTRRRVVALVAILAVALAMVALAPDTYVERLTTVVDYEEDNSAQGRLQAWGAAIQMALDFPLGVGAGNFNSAYGRLYRPAPGMGRIAYGEGRWISAHSIYFKVLGEYGFVGLGLLLCIVWWSISDTRHLATAFRRQEAEGQGRFSSALTMSLIAYSVCGTFLGGFAYPHLFLLVGLTLALKRESLVACRSASPSVREATTATPSHSMARSGLGRSH